MKLLIKLIILVGGILLFNGCTTETSKATSSGKNYQEASAINTQLGLQYLQSGNPERAKQKLLLAVEQNKSAQSYGALAYFYEKTSDNVQAEKNYLAAISIDPNAGAGHNNYGAFLCRQEKYQAAEQQFQLAVNDPKYLNTAAAYENAGLCALLIPDNQQALGYFAQALQHNPNMANSLAQLAQLNYQQGQYAAANGYLQRYIKLNSSSPDMLLLGVQVGQKLNNTALIQQYGAILKQQFPGSKQYQEYLTLVR